MLNPDANFSSPTDYINQVFCSSIANISHNHYTSQLVYTAELDADFDTGELSCTDPCIYLAKTKKKKNDSDNPSYQDALICKGV